MTWLLSKLSPFLLYVECSVLAGLALWGGVQTHRLAISKAETVEVRNAWTLDRAQATAAALKQTNDYRAETDRRNAEHLKAIDEKDQQIARQVADRVIADAASGELRKRYAAALAASRAATGNPVAVGSGSPAPASDLPADMFSGLLSVAQQYRDAAEDAITRGELAEREYDALHPTAISLGKLKLGT